MAENPEHGELQRSEVVGELVWEALKRGDIWVTMGRGGPRFRFAAGALAEVKGDAERLKDSPLERGIVLGCMAIHPCLEWADAISPVPNGMNEDAEELGERLQKPVIRMHRPVDALSRYDLRFISEADRELAADVEKVSLVEDLTSTGSSPYHQARILRSVNPRLSIHALSMMHRAPILDEYQQGEDAVTFHTLCAPSQPIPFEYDSFVEAFGITPTQVEPE